MDQAGALGAGSGPIAGYPLRLSIDPTKTSMNRLWGVPWFGVVARAILAIPVFFVLALIYVAIFFIYLVSWIPVLFTGRQASWIYAVVATYLDWSWRAAAYLLLLVGGYPISADFGAHVELDRNQHFNQLWGIPLLGIWVRGFLLIPHFVILFFLGLVAGLLVLVNWIPVLVNGRQAAVVVTWLAGFVRWYMRVAAYLLLVVSPYPPFSFD